MCIRDRSIGSFQGLLAEALEVILLPQRLALKYNTTPVSYTHLDVYKRQDHMHHLTANGHRRCAGHTFKLPDDEQIRHAAVSYTHLNAEVLRKPDRSFPFPQSMQQSGKVDHLPGSPAADAVKAAVHFHAGRAVIVEWTRCV